MKIGILTLPLYTNYGGVLQAYALQQTLKKIGHDVFHIETNDNRSFVHLSSFKFYKWWYTTRLLKELLYRDQVMKEQHRAFKKEWLDARLMVKFINEKLSCKYVREFEELQLEGFEVLVVGSDQIWRPKYFKNIEDAFLGFAEKWDIKRVAYAPSFGVDHWEYSTEQTVRCSSLLRKFDNVSVREQGGVALCKEMLDVTATCQLDPTMLVSAQAYKALVTKSKKATSFQLVTYILDLTDEKVRAIERVSNFENVSPIEIGKHINGVENHKTEKSIENWLQQFMHADFIITDSFHGCVFALLFHKPFLVFGNAERGLSRFTTLLNLFQLEARMVKSIEGVEQQYNEPIDWNKVDRILNSEKAKAIQFITESL